MVNTILAEGGTAGVPNIVGELFPNLPNFIAHVIATIVIIVILAKMVYKPFNKWVKTRREKVDELLNSAIEQQTLANKEKQEASELLEQAKNESSLIVKTARVDAEAQRNQILTQANDEANTIQSNAKNSIIREREKAESEIKESIINIAFAAAEKVLEKEVDQKTNDLIINDFINNLDKDNE